MARFDLPSGAWVVIADKRKGNLAAKVEGAVMIEGRDGTMYIPGDIQVRKTDAFLRETIEQWSLEDQGIPIPKAHGENGADMIGEVLDEDDYTALHEHVRPLVLKYAGSRPNQQRNAQKPYSSSSPSLPAPESRDGSQTG